jgi:hypothetical protein
MRGVQKRGRGGRELLPYVREEDRVVSEEENDTPEKARQVGEQAV